MPRGRTSPETSKDLLIPCTPSSFWRLYLGFHSIRTDLFHWISLHSRQQRAALVANVAVEAAALVTASCMALTLDSLPVVQGSSCNAEPAGSPLCWLPARPAWPGAFYFWAGCFGAGDDQTSVGRPASRVVIDLGGKRLEKPAATGVGFGATMVLLLVGSELVLPSWWRMFSGGDPPLSPIQQTMNRFSMKWWIGPSADLAARFWQRLLS